MTKGLISDAPRVSPSSTALSRKMRSQDGKIPAIWSRDGDEPEVFVGSGGVVFGEAGEKELKRRAMLAQLSPIHLLQLLDESLMTQLDGVLELDYFGLFEQSKALLETVYRAVEEQLGVKELLSWKEGDELDELARLAILLGKVGKDGKEKEVADLAVGVMKEFLAEGTAKIDEAQSQYDDEFDDEGYPVEMDHGIAGGKFCDPSCWRDPTYLKKLLSEK